MKNRLFITTGSISLINTLVILDGNVNDKFSDTLIIISFNQSNDFIETQKTIASLHNFEKILFFKKEREVLSYLKTVKYDCIYTIAIQEAYNKKISRYKNCYFMDEGPGYVVFDIRKFSNIKGFYSTPFLGKFSFINLPENVPAVEIKKDKFKKISKQVLILLNQSETLPTDKNILFIGHYIYRLLGDAETINFYKKYINYFIEKGYNVYFKGHPRDNELLISVLQKEYAHNAHFRFMNNSLPIEIYDYNFDLVIGAYSGTLVSLPHYRDIPAINLPMKDLYKTNIGIKFKKYFTIYDYYIPTLSEMEFILGQPKEKINSRYKEIIKNKLSLNENPLLKEIILYKPNYFTDILYSAISLLFFADKNLKFKVKNFGRRKFYKMIKRYINY